MADRCPDDQCDFEPTDGLLDRDGYETRRCCNCGEVADFFVRNWYGDCDPPEPRDYLDEYERNLEFGGMTHD